MCARWSVNVLSTGQGFEVKRAPFFDTWRPKLNRQLPFVLALTDWVRTFKNPHNVSTLQTKVRTCLGKG
jgi:hypothetical protein